MDERERLLRAALSGRLAEADQLAKDLGDLSASDLAVACVLCRDEDALPLIAAAPDVNQALAPFNWPPLLYLCFSRLQRRAEAAAAACRMAEALIGRGSDVNTSKPDGSAAHPETALYGAAGINANAELTALLLAAGADPNDGTEEIGAETLYHAAELPDNRCLRLLLAAGVAREKLSYCLARKLDFEDPEGTALFLEAGADPNFVTPFGSKETRVHKAVRNDRSLTVLDLLLAAGGRTDGEDAEGLTPYTLAMRMGRTFLIGRLLQAGACAEDAGPLDVFLGACARGDRSAAGYLVRQQPDLLAQASTNHAGHLAAAAFEGRHKAVALMLDLGFPPDARGEFGSALHMACWRGHAEAVRALVAGGADLELANDFGGTPLDTAVFAAFNCHDPQGGMTTWGLPEDVRHGDYPGVVRALLEGGADASAVNDFPTGRADIDAVISHWRQ